MASIVERELPSRTTVAFGCSTTASLDRSDDAQKLQSDATVAYANGITGRVWTNDRERRSTTQHLQARGPSPARRSPPSRAAMEAVRTPPRGRGCTSCPSTSTRQDRVQRDLRGAPGLAEQVARLVRRLLPGHREQARGVRRHRGVLGCSDQVRNWATCCVTSLPASPTAARSSRPSRASRPQCSRDHRRHSRGARASPAGRRPWRAHEVRGG